MMEETPGDSSERSAGPERPRGAPPHQLTRGMSLGRYVVLEPLGHGGMGVVYAAFDPQLDRKVALKLVRPDTRYGNLEDRRARLLKEAQVLARLSHPNVVAVHDLGTFSDQVFIAMEFVGGGSLAEWLSTPRDWRLVLQRFLEAGEGLAAAHRQGVVHLDFKPDNVLLDEAGVAHVTDFGLAWTQGVGRFRGGGTNSYKAPEQRALDGPSVSAASDQFSFCVSLHRALAKEPPFVPPDAVSGEPRPFPAGNPTPVWIRRALARGLSADPGKRYPSMDALLSALRQDPAARRRRALAQAGVALALVTAGAVPLALALRESPRERAQRECVEAARRDADALWGDARVAAMRAAFQAVDAQKGPATFDRVLPRVAPEARAWADATAAQCLVPPDSPTAAATARCLASRRRVLSSLSGLFHQPDAEVLENAATTVILEVLPVASCRLTQAPTPPGAPDTPDTPAPNEDLDGLLGNARVLRAAGKYPEAISDALRCATLAEAARDGHRQAEAQLLAGQLFADLRRLDAEDALRRAVALADAVGDDEGRAEAWLALAGWYAQRNRMDLAKDATQQADAVVARVGRPDLLEAALHAQQGTVWAYAGDSEKARQAFDTALSLRRRHLAEEHPLVLTALASRATQLPRTPSPAQLAEAIGDLEAVRATSARVFGAGHPQTVLAESQLGRVLLVGRDFEGARVRLAHAVALAAPQEQSDPIRLGRLHAALSRALAGLGRWPEAVDTAERGAQLLEAGDAPEDELEAELVRLRTTCDTRWACPPAQRERIEQLWEALGH